MSAITSAKFNIKNVTAGELKALAKSSQVYLNYAGGRLIVQGPQMTVPYDCSDFDNNGKFKVQFSFRGRDTNPKMAKFFDMMEAIDNFVIDLATKNAGKWFKMPGATRDTMKLFYKPCIRFSKDKETGAIRTEYPPTLAVSLKRKGKEGAFETEIYDEANHLIEGVSPTDALRRNAEVVPVLSCGGIWIVDSKFGVTWNLLQAAIKVPGEGGASRGFLGADEEEDSTLVTGGGAISTADEELMAAVLPTVAAPKTGGGSAKATPAPAAAAAEEGDEDEESDHETEAPPVPAKPVKVATTAVKAVKTVTKVKTAGK